jgi:hypothetical protein
MGKAYRPGRILLPPVVVFEKREGGIYASGKALPFILESLVAKGIGEIVVIDSWRYKDVLNDLPKVFSRAVRISDSLDASSKVARRVFEPFFEEFGIETDDHLCSFTRKPNSPAAKPENEATRTAGMVAACNLAEYLAAQNEKCHCHFDLSAMKEQIDIVANASRSPVTRANMAVLSGLYETYEDVEHAAIKTELSTSSEMIKLYDELLDDAKYQALSHEVSKFGLAKRGHDLKKNIGQLVRQIVDSNIGKRTIDFGATVISASTGVPVPKSDLAEAFLSSSYVPPIVNLSQPIELAKKRMLAAYPDVDFGGLSRKSEERPIKLPGG